MSHLAVTAPRALAAAILASALSGLLFSLDTELPAEATCWILVAASRRLAPGLWRGGGGGGARQRQHAAPGENIAVVAVIIASLSRAVADTRWVSPLVVPVLVGLRLFGPTNRRPLDPTAVVGSIRTLGRYAGAGLLCVALLHWPRRLAILDPPAMVIHGAALAVAYGCLEPASREDGGSGGGEKEAEEMGDFSGTQKSRPGGGAAAGGDITNNNMLMAISGSLAGWLSGIVAVTAILGLTSFHQPHLILLAGLGRAARWIAMSQLAGQRCGRDMARARATATATVPWDISLGIDTLTLSWSYGMAAAPHLKGMLLTGCSGIVALVHIWATLPAPLRGRGSGYTKVLMLVCACICVLAPLPGLAGKGDVTDLPETAHPIEQLYENGRRSYEALVGAQSRTLDAAVAEYRRRYGRPPPAGFDRWFEFARRRRSPIIDDFDLIDESLRPFWRYSADQFNKTITEAAKWNLNVVRCGFARGGDFVPGDCGAFGDRIRDLLQEARPDLPAITLTVNLLDEPAVMPVMNPDWDHMGLIWYLIQGRSSWDPIRAACEGRPRLPARFATGPAAAAVDTRGLPFVTDIMSAKDTCQHPEYNTTHGFLVAPATLAYTPWPFPFLSRAVTSPFSDIPFPSPHYVREGEMYARSDDVDWDDKINGLYWAGQATGVRVSGPEWRQGHRQRLVSLADRPPYTYLTGRSSSSPGSPTPSSWEPFSSDRLDSWLFNTHISGLVQCSFRACFAQARALRPSQWPLQPDAPTTPYRYRLALDIDGNSYSGRFYRLLASGSLTLKATIFREWHDDRLVPWYHYVPVSVGLEELPELVRFLTRTERGRGLARRIAQNGREWHGRALRAEDMGIYLYRLILELAVLTNPMRAPGATEVAAATAG